MVEGGREIDEVAAGETCWMGLSKQLSKQLVDDRQVHRYGMTDGGKRHKARVYPAGEVSLRFGGERVGGAGRISWSSLLQGDQTWMLVLLYLLYSTRYCLLTVFSGPLLFKTRNCSCAPHLHA